MSHKVYGVMVGFALSVVMLMSGCGPKADLSLPKADLSLQFSPNQTARYKSVSDSVKNFRFEQPTLGKLREEQTRSSLEMTFTQTIQNVDSEGNATANITIDGMKVNIITKNEETFSFDSEKQADINSPLTKLLGQSYMIEISPDGTVSVLDTKKATAAVSSGYAKKVAESILDNKNIIERHQISALPKQSDNELKVGKSWDTVVPSPPGLLAPKSYKKVYTLTDIETVNGKTIAKVNMTAEETAELAEDAGTSPGGMGMFAKMFDNEDTYTGSMMLNIDTNTVLKAQEELVSTYLAQEMPENGDPEKGPDTLTMQFTYRVQLEKLD